MTYENVTARIDRLLDMDDLATRVQRYFNPNRNFAGATFTTLGENTSNEITVDDLLAVALLDTPFGPRATRQLLEQGGEFNALLSKVADVPIWMADDSVIGDGSPADQLYRRLDDLKKVGPTRASKLMARKRPQLIPIVDKVVASFLRAPKGQYWLAFREALSDEERRRRIDRLRPGGAEMISTLRVLDAAIWMGALATRNRRRRRRVPLCPRERFITKLLAT